MRDQGIRDEVIRLLGKGEHAQRVVLGVNDDRRDREFLDGSMVDRGVGDVGVENWPRLDDREMLSIISSISCTPSRFGYLGSDLPAGATPKDQADAFAALLDHLELASGDPAVAP